ncbi:DUF221-domain-containing protein [Mycena indigotica]|uniref:DUF221-domain-containing protein n=1 Tax=Mycena indigotica TaxID=2126181 RepID=A0A8H6TED8_9AGAR|nr:DUF221-domain-containing protein [Mycena indigotica]KAF7315162.1 DUF221-domain-containing protein [Mycena indigotica]
MPFDAQDLQDAFDAGRTLAPAAVGTQILLMSGISLATLVLFNLLRPRNKIVYEPKVKYHVGEKAPPTIRDTCCGWLPPLIQTKEPELLELIGLDAVAYLRFLRLMRQLFACVAIVACAILIPIDYKYNMAHVKAAKRDFLSALTIRDVKGSKMYAHVTVYYLISFIVLALVYIHGRAMVKLRNDFFRSPEYMKSFYARTISITHIPQRLQQDTGLTEILGKGSPYHPTSLHIGRAVGELPHLVEYHNQTVRDFEAVLVKYLRGGVHTQPRPMIKLGGFCGLGGTPTDAIEYYTKKLKRTEGAVEEFRARIDARRPESYGFASYAAVPYAHFIAQHAKGRHPRGATTSKLLSLTKPQIWENMNQSRKSISVKRLIGFGWLTVICFLSLIPLLLVAALANMDAVKTAGYLPFLDKWSGHSAVTFSIVSGVLPPIVSGLFTIFLPRVMRWLGRYQGASTRAQLDRAVVARYFAFLVISQLIVFTLIGVMINYVTELVKFIGRGTTIHEVLGNLNKLPGRISKAYINTSTYWLKFFPLRGFLVVFDLAQIMKLAWISFKTKVMGRTPREYREWTQPPTFEYAIYYSNLLFMACVGLVFAPQVPLVSLAAAIVFWISSWVYKYQLMFVFVTKVETGGRLWNVVINRVLVSLFLMQCLMALTIGLRFGFRKPDFAMAFPPMLILFVFKFYMDRKFSKNFYFYLPNEEELRNAHVHSGRGDTVKHKLENRFGHPSLHEELFTPMVHADQMDMLRKIYGGKIEEDKNHTKDVEVLDGLRIQAIQQRDLQYDPVLYSRDRGEYYDYDRYSMASSGLLSPHLQVPGPSSPWKGNNQSPGVSPGLTPTPLPYQPSYYSESILSGSSANDPRQSVFMTSPAPMGPGSPPPQGYFDPRHSVLATPPPGGHIRQESFGRQPMSPGMPLTPQQQQRMSRHSPSSSRSSQRMSTASPYPPAMPGPEFGHQLAPSQSFPPQRMSQSPGPEFGQLAPSQTFPPQRMSSTTATMSVYSQDYPNSPPPMPVEQPQRPAMYVVQQDGPIQEMPRGPPQPPQFP